MAAVLATGAILGLHYYRQTSRLVLEASDNVFTAMGRDVVQELARTYAPVQTLVDVLAAQQALSQSQSASDGERRAAVFVEALRGNPALAAIYVGYDNGAFLLVRPTGDEHLRALFDAPGGTAYVVQNVDIESNGAQASFRYLREDFSTIEVRARPDFRFDPRTRDWYRAALDRRRHVWTAPYVFFTTREPGITVARAAGGSAVVGADVTLENISKLLRKQPVGPSTELFLMTDDGHVLAYRDDSTTSQPPSSGTALRLRTLDEFKGNAVPALAAHFASGAHESRFSFDTEKGSWIGRIFTIDSGYGRPLYLAAAAPTAELLQSVRRITTQGWIVTGFLIALAIPLAWLTASVVSRPLHRLADAARKIQRFDFGPDASVRPIVRELEDLESAIAEGKSTVRRFLDISGALALERDVDRLVERVLDEVTKLAKADGGSIYLFDDSRRTLEPTHHLPRRGFDECAAPVSIAFDTARSPRSAIVEAAATGRTIVTDMDASQEPGDGCRSTLAVPLRDRAGQIDGVLCLFYDRARAADEFPRTVAFVEKISGVAAISIETQRLIGDQKKLLESFIQLIAAAIDAKSPYTGGHCQRVPDLTRMLAEAACDARDGPFRDFTLSEDEWEAVRIASWLHDCGKVTTPEYVVDKATKLETLYNRIHELRMRFEVLKRDAEVAYWRGCAEGGDAAKLRADYEGACASLDSDFAFVAGCNVGDEPLDAAAVDRLEAIGRRTWQRTLDDCLGVSWEERGRMARRDPSPLPVTERLLADKLEHIVERAPEKPSAGASTWGFSMRPPPHRYNRGELHNLRVARGTLTEEERYAINDHIVQTIVMLEKLPFPRHLKSVPELAGGHHEKVDGTGYPRGLFGTQMSPVARMMAIADIFEALTASDRPYKRGKTLSEALAIMARMRRDRHIDSDLFDLFVTEKVYQAYAERFLSPEQIDDVRVEQLRAGTQLEGAPQTQQDAQDPRIH